MQFSNELSRLDKSQRDKQHPNNKKLYLLVAILEIKGADGIAQMVNMLQRRKLQKRDCLGKIHSYNILKREMRSCNKGHCFPS